MAMNDDECDADRIPSWAHLDMSIDLGKFFEQVRRLLPKTGAQHSYPLVALRLSLATYSFQRRILGPYDIAGQVGRASRGIAAGSAHATSELKLYLMPVILATQHRALAATNLVTSLSVFVDDISYSVSSPDEATTLDAVVTVFRALREELSSVDLDKNEAIASTDGLRQAFATIIVVANPLANTCNKIGGRLLHWAPPKGARLTSRTKARLAAQRWRLPVRELRNRNFRRRAAICIKTFRTIPHRAVVRYGLLPSLLHGTDLGPISSLALHQARLAVCRADRIFSAGMPMLPLLALLGYKADPAFHAFSLAVLRIAREAWLLSPRARERPAHQDALQCDELLHLCRLISRSTDGKQVYIDWLRDEFQYFRILPRTPLQSSTARLPIWTSPPNRCCSTVWAKSG
jgi:hypothetical protein